MPTDDQSLKELLAEQRPALLRLALTKCGNAADAEDLVQDTMERAIAGAAGFASGTNLRSWLARILFNRFIDRCREDRVRRHIPTSEENDVLAAGEAEERPAWEWLTRADVDSAVEELEPELRTVFLLKERRQLSYAAMAAELRIPIGTVGTQLWRARRRLKELLVRRIKL